MRMGAVLVLLGLGAAYWLALRDVGAADEPPDVRVDAPDSPEVSAGSGAGAFVDASTAIEDFDREATQSMIGSAIAGGIKGAKLGGPVGAALGAVFGWWAAAFKVALADRPEAPPIPWEKFALPFRPDLTKRTRDGAFRVWVPGPDLESWSIDITEDKLREVFPGEGAVEACRKSGMFCWRPGDNSNPFQELLHEAAPWLADVEASLRLDSPEGYELDEPIPDVGASNSDLAPATLTDMRWETLLPVPSAHDDAAKAGWVYRLVHMARRLSALRVFEFGEVSWHRDEWGREGATSPILHSGNRLPTWLGQFMTELRDGTEERHRIAGWLQRMCVNLHVPIFGCASSTARGDCTVVNVKGGDPRGPWFTAAHRGYPGAWRWVDESSGAFEVWLPSGSQVYTLEQFRDAVPPETSPLALTSATLSGLSRFGDKTTAERDTSRASLATVREKLETGRLAWRPNLPEAVHDVYSDPAFDRLIQLRRAGRSLGEAYAADPAMWWDYLYRSTKESESYAYRMSGGGVTA